MRILDTEIRLIDLETRLPFKYGIATMTRAPQAFVQVRCEIDGREASGVAADILPPKWFTKVAEKPLDDEIAEMLSVIEHAARSAVGLVGASACDVWRALDEQQSAWGRENQLPPLLSNFGTTLVERAVIEASCRAAEITFAEAVRTGALGLRPGDFHARLRGLDAGELLPREPLRQIIARHTIGMADPLRASEIAPEDRLRDGLPQSLDECIARYGLRHFKVKVKGDLEHDVERLNRVAETIAAGAGTDIRFTLDGNEQFRTLEAFRDYWERLTTNERLGAFFARLMFVEQPFHRDVALDGDVLGELAAWSERPRLIIDESDAEIDSFARALALGYHGTSHKNCKGVFKSILNAMLVEMLRREDPRAGCIMSGEDLANIGPVALLQDLAVAATLGIESVERNGHHYFAGLSAFPQDIQRQILASHGDLYGPSEQGWPTLRIAGGRISVESVVAAPLGVGCPIDVGQFRTVRGDLRS
ncbi:MAG: hypothetical protein KY475_23035 [Planctomycetes bacterium]|nr:hypothetical protein [Planctomycetota bacterium]